MAFIVVFILLHIKVCLVDRYFLMLHFRALAQVSCEVVEPKESRPKEGLLFVNIDLSPMASPAFETGR